MDIEIFVHESGDWMMIFTSDAKTSKCHWRSLHGWPKKPLVKLDTLGCFRLMKPMKKVSITHFRIFFPKRKTDSPTQLWSHARVRELLRQLTYCSSRHTWGQWLYLPPYIICWCRNIPTCYCIDKNITFIEPHHILWCSFPRVLQHRADARFAPNTVWLFECKPGIRPATDEFGGALGTKQSTSALFIFPRYWRISAYKRAPSVGKG